MTLLSTQQLERISSAVTDLTPAQLAWVGGYLSGMSLGQNNVIQFPHVAAVPVPAQQPALTTTILYGSQTGNGKKIAEKLQQVLGAAGHSVVLKNLLDYRPQQLKKEQRILFVVSTHGNGEAPDDARTFFQFLNGARAPQLAQLEYAVLALGDSSYDEFCQTGLELDQRLETLGATRWLPRIDCDVDFAEDAASWQTQILDQLHREQAKNTDSAVNANTVTAFQPTAVGAAVQQAVLGTADAPYQAELLAATPLTDVLSDKDVLHLEFSLEDSGIQYQPGDILAVQVRNDAALVAGILAHTGLAADSRVQIKGKTWALDAALLEKLEISTITRKQLNTYATQTEQAALAALAQDKTALLDYLEAADWLDVLQDYPASLTAQALVDLLRPLQVREYSIASSLEAHPEEVHLLVKRVEYPHAGREHLGAGSNWLARLQAGELAQIYIKANERFKLPAQDDTKIIMVGAGTGVAPFRSFLFEREARGVSGNSWLFFGEQHFQTDFLYQAEWLNHLKSGVLEHMSVAFSRDQAEKVYVQQRLLEAGAEVWQWLQDGAHFYVCGDMHKMAKDVNAALLQIIVEHGGRTSEQAAAELEQWITTGRYQRDVY